MPAISQLFVELKLQAESFNNDIRAAQKEAKEFEKTIKPSKEAAQELGTAMTLAGGAVVASFLAATKATADYGDKINDMSKKTGVSTEILSKWGFAAEQSGSTLEGVGKGLTKLAVNMEAATSGSKTQMAAFKAAGITSKDLADAHGDVNKILPKLADAFAGAKDGAGKTAIAMALLGKSGTELIPMLNEGSAGLDRMGRAAEAAGRVVSQDAARSADEFNDHLAELQGSVMGISGVIGNTLIPPLTNLMVKLTPIVQGVREWVAEHPGLIQGIGAAAAILTGAGGLLLGLTGVIAIIGPLTVAFGILTGPIVLTTAAIGLLVAGVIYFRKEIGEALLIALSGIIGGLEKFLGGVQSVARAVGADGLADKIATAKFGLQEFRVKIDDMVTASMSQQKAIDGTATKLAAEAKARTDSSEALGKNTLKLSDNTEAAGNNRKKIEDIIKGNTQDLNKHLSDTEAAGRAWIGTLSDVYVKDLAAKSTAFDTIENIVAKNRADMGRHAEGVASDSRAWLGVQSRDYVDSLDKRIKDATDAEKTIADRAKQAYGDVKQAAGEIFDAMFLKGENVFTSLTNALKGGALSLGRAIFQDVTASLLGPVKAAFDDFFRGLLEGAGLKSFIAGLGRTLGGALSGILGKGASGTLPSIAGGGAGAGGAVIGGGAGGGFLTAAVGFATNPITIAIAAGILGTTLWLKSQAHHEANTFVRDFENPFAEKLGILVEQFNEAASSGQLTSAQAMAAGADIGELWKAFIGQAQTFGAKGSDERTVVAQMFGHMGPLMEEIFSGITSVIKRLQDAEGTQVLSSANVTLSSGGEIQSQVRNAMLRPAGFSGPAGSISGPISLSASNVTLSSGGDVVPFQTATLRRPPGFQHGTDYVPETGLAIVHQGERIIPAERNNAFSGPVIGTLIIHADSQTSGRRVAAELIDELETNGDLRYRFAHVFG